MGYIRFGYTAIIVFILFILSIPVLLIDLLIGVFSMKARDKFTMGVVRVTFSIAVFLTGIKVHVSGLENIPKDKAVVYIGNHRSFIDVLVSYKLFPEITAFIAKKEFEKVPILSWWMKLLHNLFLDRHDIKQGTKIILKAIEQVNNGISAVIFPEGTRNKTYEQDITEFHEGSFKIATKSGCPIVMMTMYNMSAALEDHFPQIRNEHVYIDFAKPFTANELDPEDKKHIGAYTREKMLVRYDELRKEHEKIIAKK